MHPAATVLASAVALLGAATMACAATIPVTTTDDVLAEDGVCSLREAVQAAAGNAPKGGCPAGAAGAIDDIRLGPLTYRLTIPPDGSIFPESATGDLVTVSGEPVRIAGAGASRTVIDVNGISRALAVPPGGALTVEDLTIRGGRAGRGSIGFFNGPLSGGAITSGGALTVARVAFIDNRAGSGSVSLQMDGELGAGGGAIGSSGPLTVTDSTFMDNRAGDGGPGGLSDVRAPVGGAGADGGAILIAGGQATIARSLFAGNRAGMGGEGGTKIPLSPRGTAGRGGRGGAIWAGFGATLAVENSTFVGNQAGALGAGGAGELPGEAGALFAADGTTASIAFATLTGNGRATGSTGANGVRGATVGASIIGDAAPACAAVVPGLRNLVPSGDASCGDAATGSAELQGLVDNGGAVFTMLPGAGSAAIDLVTGAPCPATDARGLPRPRGAGCDAGAVEIQPPGSGPTTGGGPSAPRLTGLRLSRASVRPLGPRPLAATVTFRLDAAARVTFTVRKLLPGRRLRARCVPPARAPKARRCVRRVPIAGKIVRAGLAGPNQLRLTGRLRDRVLPPGRYELVARVAGGAPLVRAFRVLR